MTSLPNVGTAGNPDPIPRGVEWALYASRCGWHVFPLSEGNVPFQREVIATALGIDPSGPAGVHHATIDEIAIATLWSGNRCNARIGLAMGNGRMAIDCDEKNGKSGRSTMIANGWAVPETAGQRTQSGGTHYIVTVPPGTTASTDAGVLGSGLDRRGDGGYIALYDPAMLTAIVASAPEWSLGHAKPPHGQRIGPGQGRRAPTPEVALDALLSCDPADMDRNRWLLLSGSYFAATNGLIDDDHALANWQEWNVAYGAANDPGANARTWKDFCRHGTAGDFNTLADLSNDGNAKCWRWFNGIDRTGQPPIVTPAKPITAASNFFIRARDMEYRPPEYHVDSLIETDSLAVLFGDPAAGKSFIAIDMACCVATGTDFHGHKVKQGAVFYVLGEGGNGIKRRLNAWEKHNNQSMDDAPLYISVAAAQFLNTQSAAMVTTAVNLSTALHGAPRLIIVDTLARNFGPGDENSSTDMNMFIVAMDTLRREFAGCTIMVVHHSGHGDKDRARGSSALKAAVDAEYKVSKNDSQIKFENHKMKDGPSPRTMEFQLTDIGFSAALTYSGEPVGTSNVLKGINLIAWDAFNKCGGDVVATDQWRQLFNDNRPDASPDANRKAFGRAVDDLTACRALMTDDDKASYRRVPMPGIMPAR